MEPNSRGFQLINVQFYFSFDGLGVSTDEIMDLALKMAGFDFIPEDSEIYVPKKDVKRALFSIDVGVPGLMLAKKLGCDVAIAHHPEAGRAAIEGFKVFRRHVDFMIKNGIPKEVAKRPLRER